MSSRQMLGVCSAILLFFLSTSALAHRSVRKAHAQKVSMPLTVHSSPVNCMAQAMYHEARGESEEGLAAVGFVIRNRTRSDQFPDSICRVVLESHHANGKKVCQFSWTCKPIPPMNKGQFQRAQMMALLVLKGLVDDPVHGAVYFRAIYDKGRPSQYAKRLKRIDNHVFFADTRIHLPAHLGPVHASL